MKNTILIVVTLIVQQVLAQTEPIIVAEYPPKKFEYKSSFSNGLVLVSNGKKYGYFDKNGKAVIPVKYDFAGSFQNGYASVILHSNAGFINTTGKAITGFKYKFTTDFDNGLAKVCNGIHCGFIDTTGTEVIPVEYEDANVFMDVITTVQAKDQQWYIIDK